MLIIDVEIFTLFKEQIKIAINAWEGPPASKPELEAFCLNHERLPFVIKQLGMQIESAEKKLGIKMDRAKRDEIIFTTARYFVYVSVEHRKQQNLSEVARITEENRSGIRADGTYVGLHKEMAEKLKEGDALAGQTQTH